MSEYRIPAWMKKAEPFKYVRISDKDQSPDEANLPLEKQTPLASQNLAIDEKMKALGLKSVKAKNTYYEIASGGTFERPVLNKMIQDVLEHKGRAYIVVAEPSRWGRNSILGGEAFAPLYKRDIPILSATDELITGTISDPRTNSQFLFLIKQGVSEGERGQLIDRVRRRIESNRAKGILSASIGSLYPFARNDPLDVLEANLSLLAVPVKDGGGGQNLGRLIESTSAPYGASQQWQFRERQRLDERIGKLTPDEHNIWRAYRKKIRAIMKDRDFDPARDAPIQSLNRKDIDFGIKALIRNAGGYIRYPFDDAYSMLSDEEIQDILDNPREFLSDADKKAYRRLVDKKKVRR